MSTVIRVADRQDAQACAKILGDWFTEVNFVQSVHTAAEDLNFLKWLIENQTVLVAETDGVVGFMARDREEISQIYLRPDARGFGIGRQFLDRAMTDNTRLWLWCFQANSAARGFYEYAGFQAVEFTDGADNEEKTPDVRYVWERS